MSECVVRMERVPKNCDDGCWGSLSGECPWCDSIDGYEMVGNRPPNCPIIAVLPEGHGRLVDADALVNQWATVPDKLSAGAGENKWVADMVMGIQGHFLEGIIKSLEEAPTIVPAERSET